MTERVTSICLTRVPEGIGVSCTVEGVLGVGTEDRETVYGDPEELLDWLREWMAEPSPLNRLGAEMVERDLRELGRCRS